MIPTTSILVYPNQFDFSVLNAHYKIVRYAIPKGFKQLVKHGGKGHYYAKLENQYKERLDKPCYLFRHDSPLPAIYVLYQKDDNVEQSLSFEIEKTEGKVTPFVAQATSMLPQDLKTHVLLKLLLANFFYNEHQPPHRICQHYFYLLGKIEKDRNQQPKGFARGVHVRLQETEQRVNEIEYAIHAQTKNFSVVKPKHFNPATTSYRPYFEKVIKATKGYFRQIKPSKVAGFVKNTEKELWKLSKTSQSNRAKLVWFKEEDPETRSFVLFHFQKNYLNHLHQLLGAKAAQAKVLDADKLHRRNIEKPQSKPGFSNTGLPVFLMQTIYVYDNRLQAKGRRINQSLSLQQYVAHLNTCATQGHLSRLNIQFRPVTSLNELSTKELVLVLQDVTGEEFQTNHQQANQAVDEDDTGKSFYLNQLLLADPKPMLYDKYSQSVALQSYNVNTNEFVDKFGRFKYGQGNYTAYFDYGLMNLKDEKIGIAKNKWLVKLQVCLNELLLKHLIINNLPIAGKMNGDVYALPGIAEKPEIFKRYAFQFNGIFLFVGADYTLQFIRLNDHASKMKRNEVLKSLGVSWEDIEVEISDVFDKKGKTYEEILEKIDKARLVFSIDLAFEIQDIEERIFFNYGDNNQMKRYPSTAKKGNEGLWYDNHYEQYIVGLKDSMNQTMEKAIRCRKLYFFQGKQRFNFDDLGTMMAVQFVRNKQYTVYPYFFDLIELYREVYRLK